MSDLSIAIAGITGRMGRAIIDLCTDSKMVTVTGGIAAAAEAGQSAASLFPGADLEFPLVAEPAQAFGAADVLIDFSAPAALSANLAAAIAAKTPMIIGTTGYTEDQEAEIANAARVIAIVKSGNMSPGINLLTHLVEQAARALGPDYDIEIFEAHHRHKKDAPSGTALMLGAAAAQGRGLAPGEREERVRDGQTGPREAGAIGYAVQRAGGIIGDHAVCFGADTEMLTLSHRALDRRLFAKGALEAAKWVKDRPPGLYSMRDVLGLG